jgi:ribonuclease VapC
LITIDTSAVIAALAEDDGPAYAAAIGRARAPVMSAVSYYEAHIVLGSGRFGSIERVLADFHALLQGAGTIVTAFDRNQALLAHFAYRAYGKGTGHPAHLNLADCAAYALAHSTGFPLLYKGQDFAHTNVPSVEIYRA